MAYKGKFTPKNPSKYKGNPTNIIYRSLWERKLMFYLDKHTDVILWSSEEFCIAYRSPIDGKVHRYFPDFWVKKKNRDGKINISVLEVKPKAQCKPPLMELRKKHPRRFINQVKTYGINEAKWRAADHFCKDRNWDFKLITEDNLGV